MGLCIGIMSELPNQRLSFYYSEDPDDCARNFNTFFDHVDYDDDDDAHIKKLDGGIIMPKKVKTADCIDVCKSILGENCIADYDDNEGKIVLWSACALRGYISLSGISKGVFYYTIPDNVDCEKYHSRTFDRPLKLRDLLKRHYLSCYNRFHEEYRHTLMMFNSGAVFS